MMNFFKTPYTTIKATLGTPIKEFLIKTRVVEHYTFEVITYRQIKFLFILLTPALFACNNGKDKEVHLPSPVYHYVQIDTSALATKHSVYVPVYSHIYTGDGTSALKLSATLSVRNTSYTDSFYITDVIYYGSQGEVLKRYLPGPVLVRPMTSVEFMVERNESKGGAGANFVVKWGAPENDTEPLIQTIMNELGAGISFVTNGVEMK